MWTSVVMSAIRAEDVDSLRRLVAQYGEAAVRLEGDMEELTALHWASAVGSLSVVSYLLGPPILADACAARRNGFTPLHAAAMAGHAAVCARLLQAGAGVNVQTDPQGYTPLHSAAFAGHEAAIRVLLAHGADRRRVNYRGERPLETALRTGQVAAARLLAVEADA